MRKTDKGGSETSMHEYYMGEALKEASKACKKDEVPIGAVIVKDGVILARGHNQRELKKDATLHAEITAIRRACKKLDSWRLNGCDIYVTLEPCAMCAGAMIQARIRKVYIGTSDPKAGSAGSVVNLFGVNGFNHTVEVAYGILENKCSGILKDFFKGLRLRKADQCT